MLIEHFFSSMTEMVNRIARHLPPDDPQEIKKLEDLVQGLKQMSDSILDEWIKFEENFNKKLKPYFTSLSESPLEEFKKGLEEPKKIVLPDLIKGQGYYDLGMYADSYPIFQEFVQTNPDDTIGRLYLAYNAMILGEKDEALKQFHLLEKTAEKASVRAVCLNAIGCLSFEHNDYETAGKYFSAARIEDEHLFVAYFNLGMAYYLQSAYRKAIAEWENYLTLVQEWDLEVIFYLASCYLKLGEYQKALRVWHHPKSENNLELLMEFRRFFEDYHCYKEAMECYQGILQLKPDHPEAIHGYAWNQWLFTNCANPAIMLLKKAHALSPQNKNIAFSLAWIYYQQEQYDLTERIVEHLIKMDEKQPLTIALAFLLAVKREHFDQAEELANQLRMQKEKQTIALGDLFLGKLKLSQGEVEDAIEAFKRSVWNNPNLKQSYMLQGLAYYLNHQPEKAQEVWEKNNFLQAQVQGNNP